MDEPKVAVHLNKDGDVVYGWQLGLKLVYIKDVFRFKDKVWFHVNWQGYEMLEAVPAEHLHVKFPKQVFEFFERIGFKRGPPVIESGEK